MVAEARPRRLTNRDLIGEYVRLRAEINVLTEQKEAYRDLILLRMQENGGRLFSQIGVAILKRVRYRGYYRKAIDLLVMAGRLKREDVAPAYWERVVDRVEVNGIPEVTPFEHQLIDQGGEETA